MCDTTSLGTKELMSTSGTYDLVVILTLITRRSGRILERHPSPVDIAQVTRQGS